MNLCSSAQYMLTFTEFTCLPVSAMVFTPQTGWITFRSSISSHTRHRSYFIFHHHSLTSLWCLWSRSFYNHLLGVQNPQDLVPPFFCPTAAPEEHLPRTSFLKAIRPAPLGSSDWFLSRCWRLDFRWNHEKQISVCLQKYDRLDQTLINKWKCLHQKVPCLYLVSVCDKPKQLYIYISQILGINKFYVFKTSLFLLTKATFT